MPLPRLTPARFRVCLIMLVGALQLVGQTAEPPINFDRQIRPILSENCFHCHGPDAEGRQGDLRLDTATARPLHR
jgi:hypothetical protein